MWGSRSFNFDRSTLQNSEKQKVTNQKTCKSNSKPKTKVLPADDTYNIHLQSLYNYATGKYIYSVTLKNMFYTPKTLSLPKVYFVSNERGRDDEDDKRQSCF